MSIQVTSTTDTPEEVLAAQGGAAPKDVEVQDKSAASEKEAEKTEDSETSESPDKEESDYEADESESDGSDESEKPKEVKKKSGNGFKKRVDKLNQKLTAKEQEVAYWREQALKKQSSEGEAKEPAKPLTSNVADGKPKPEDFETHAEYVEALTDYKLEQRERERDIKQKEQKLKSDYDLMIEGHNKRLEEFKKNQTDFDDVIAEFLEDRGGDAQFSLAAEEAIANSDLGPQIVYELAKNMAEFDRINSLGPIAAAREIGKIEARLQKESDSSQEKQEAKTTKAPKPVSTVASMSGATSTKSPENMDFQEYKQWRAKQARA